jgi:acetyl-CoA carboxylase biotin carboxyl carrier protein
MNVDDIERLLGLLERANIRELTLRENGARITIRKTPEEVAHSSALVPVSYETYELHEEEGRDHVHPIEPSRCMVTAPLVGFFHHIKPMVGLGAQVKQGQVIGIIEAMKLINDVKAPVGGTVTDVLVEDGLPVEYGQLLFEINPES